MIIRQHYRIMAVLRSSAIGTGVVRSTVVTAVAVADWTSSMAISVGTARAAVSMFAVSGISNNLSI